jgi:hypothetical protein
VEYEPVVLLTETVKPGQFKRLLLDNGQVQQKQCLNESEQSLKEEVHLNEVHLDSELMFTGDDESCGDVWYLDNGASNHMTGDF